MIAPGVATIEIHDDADFRDHTEGARALQAAGARVVAPYWEEEYFVDPEQHFRERQIWNSYADRSARR